MNGGINIFNSTQVTPQSFDLVLIVLSKVQRTKKVVSDSPRLVDFAIGQVNSVFNLPDGQVMFLEEFE